MVGEKTSASTDGLDVAVYRSLKRADTYLLLPVDDEYDDLPEALRLHFGRAAKSFEFRLTQQRTLAQADPVKVLDALAEQGFYLQLPPGEDA
jgi:uncharacterized protein YcgL (UPF0745 family)